MNDDWEKACWTFGGLALGFIGAEFRNWRARKQARFDAVVERYVAEIRLIEDPKIRLVAMQRAGVASLSPNQFMRFVS